MHKFKKFIYLFIFLLISMYYTNASINVLKNVDPIMQKIKKTSKKYTINPVDAIVNNTYLIKGIENNFEELKIELSMLDAELKLTAENATSKTIVTATKSLNFLKKYGFNVISLDDDNTAIEKTVEEINNLAKVSSIKYIYTLDNVENNETVALLLENNKNLTEIKLKRLDSITDEERANGEDYFSLMRYNIDQIKKETYK